MGGSSRITVLHATAPAAADPKRRPARMLLPWLLLLWLLLLWLLLLWLLLPRINLPSGRRSCYATAAPLVNPVAASLVAPLPRMLLLGLLLPWLLLL